MKYKMKLDTRQIKIALDKIGKNTDGTVLGQAVMAGLFTLEGYAKLNIRSTFKQRTGFLASNFETKLDSVSPTNAKGHTSPLAVYARIHELGGVIRSTSGYLRFQTDDGEWHTVASVTIPARPYLRPAVDEHQEDIIASVGNVLTGAIEG